MIALGFFTEDAYEQLIHDIEKNKDNYKREDDWLADYFSNNSHYYENSSVLVNSFMPIYNSGNQTDPQKTSEDLINTKRLYSAFKNLTPLQASNKYMWTYLCHAIPEYRKYIINRWMTNEQENTIKTRFFVTNNGSLLNDNALSRLWWYGYLTYDESNKENPFALTDVLLTNQTICTDVMDTLNRMNFNRMKGILMAIKAFKEQIPENEGITECFRECKKYMNHYAAVTTLEYLTSEETCDLALKYMISYRNRNNRSR